MSGALAQLGERRTCTAEVIGSSPIRSIPEYRNEYRNVRQERARRRKVASAFVRWCRPQVPERLLAPLAARLTSPDSGLLLAASSDADDDFLLRDPDCVDADDPWAPEALCDPEPWLPAPRMAG